MSRKIRIVLCDPAYRAAITEIAPDLLTMQEIVAGPLQFLYPFSDPKDSRVRDIALACNKRGNYEQLCDNRLIRASDGGDDFIVVGTFFFCFRPENGGTASLPEDIAEWLRTEYEMPEMHFKDEQGISAVRCFAPDIKEARPEILDLINEAGIIRYWGMQTKY